MKVEYSMELQQKLISTAEKIAREIPLDLVRVDLYVVNEEVYAGEVTLSSDGGTVPILPLPPEYPL